MSEVNYYNADTNVLQLEWSTSIVWARYCHYRQSASTNSGGSMAVVVWAQRTVLAPVWLNFLPHYALMRLETMESAAMTQLVCIWPH